MMIYHKVAGGEVDGPPKHLEVSQNHITNTFVIVSTDDKKTAIAKMSKQSKGKA